MLYLLSLDDHEDNPKQVISVIKDSDEIVANFDSERGRKYEEVCIEYAIEGGVHSIDAVGGSDMLWCYAIMIVIDVVKLLCVLNIMFVVIYMEVFVVEVFVVEVFVVEVLVVEVFVVEVFVVEVFVVEVF